MSIQRLDWLKANPAACFKPFLSLFLRSHYELDRAGIRHSCCCNLDTDFVPPGQEQTFFRDLRINIREGKMHPACHLCYKDEATGAMSERLKNWLMIDDVMFDRVSGTFQDGSFELYVKFSNSCPLACRSCDGRESSTYAKISHQSVEPQIIQDFTDDPETFEMLKSMVRNMHDTYECPILHITGGEPLVQQGCKRLMGWMKNNGLSEKFTLRITTAWSVNMDDEFADLVRSFGQVWFIISLDSVGHNYQYVRWPVQFNKIERNLESLAQFIYDRPSSTTHLILTPVISLNNAFYLKDYFDWVAGWLAANALQAQISMIHLYQPAYLKIENIPQPYRSQLIKVFQDCVNHPLVQEQSQSALKYFIESSIEQLSSDSHNAHEWRQFLHFTAEFDTRTNTSFSAFNSRLYDILTETDKGVYLDCLTRTNTEKPLANIISRSWNIFPTIQA